MMISMILISFFGCKKEYKSSDQEKVLFSSSLLIPGEIFCDEDYCYWIDPELWDEPIEIQSTLKGPADQKGYPQTFIRKEGEQWIIEHTVHCYDTGDICGKLYRLEGTDWVHAGNYLVNY